MGASTIQVKERGCFGISRAARDRDGPYASPALPDIVWTRKGKTYRHVIHEEADETEAIACTGGEESLARMSGVS
jgi:hypothetical protein